MGEKSTDRSFAGGEISPDMYGRVDLAKYQTGLALCRNAFVLPHGPVENRPGTEFVKATKNNQPVRLIPFTFNFTQTMCIEVGAGYFRFHTQAGTLLAGSLPAWAASSSPVTLTIQESSTVTINVFPYTSVGISWANHGLSPGDPVTFATTGTLPAYMTAGTPYYVMSTGLTADLFYISTTPGGSNIQGPSAQSGTQTATANPPMVVTWASHGLQSGQAITLATTGNLPTGLTVNQVYYVINPTTNTFQLALAPGGAALVATGTQSGTQTVNVTFAQGALVSYGGTNYYCIQANATANPTNADYWYPMPSDGTYEIPNPYAASELMSIHYVQNEDVLTLVHPNHPVQELERQGSTVWTLVAPSFAIPSWAPSSCSAAVTDPHTTNWNPFVYDYCVTTVENGDYQESTPSPAAICSPNDLTLVGNVNTITWTAPESPPAAGIARYNVYKNANGLWGFIGQAGAGTYSFIDNNIAPNTSQTPPICDSGFNDAVGDYPGAVTYYQQRKWFAGSTNNPQNTWATVTGTENNLTYTLPVQANNRLSFKIAAREASGIAHLVPVANLIMLTNSTEWRCTSTDGNAVWAGNLYVQPQSYVGANNVQPITVANTVLFSQSRGSRIREMTYQYMSQAYVTNDLSVMAAHLFDYQQIYDMAFSKAPYPILHCVSSNGNLVSLTYVPEQQVAAWHHHDFGGFVESVCCITEQPAGTLSSEDMVYLVVNRVINGQTARYIERIHTRYFNTMSDAWFVDSGATNALPGTYSMQGGTITLNIMGHGTTQGEQMYFTFSDSTLNGYYDVASVIDANDITLTTTNLAQEKGTVNMTPQYQITTLSGLTWLAGMAVNVLADGAPVPGMVVSSTGTLTLPYPATKVIVGLPITCQVEPLPAAFQTDPGFGESLMKSVDQVWLRLYRSAGLSVGPDYNTLTPVMQRQASDAPGSPPAMMTGVYPIVLNTEWNQDAEICIQQTDPLPFTLCSIASDTAVR